MTLTVSEKNILALASRSAIQGSMGRLRPFWQAESWVAGAKPIPGSSS